MKLTTTQLISILAVILLTFACLFRYTVIPANAGGEGNHAPAYKLDRWTGSVELMYQGVYVEVTRRKE